MNEQEQLNILTDAYLEAALYYGTALDNQDYAGCDWSSRAIREARFDCKRFLQIVEYYHILPEKSLRTHNTLSDLGHDFWLSARLSGAGFDDGDWDKELYDGVGEELTRVAEMFPEEMYLWVENDEIFFDGGTLRCYRNHPDLPDIIADLTPTSFEELITEFNL